MVHIMIFEQDNRLLTAFEFPVETWSEQLQKDSIVNRELLVAFDCNFIVQVRPGFFGFLN
jgi:hypothetical protein